MQTEEIRMAKQLNKPVAQLVKHIQKGPAKKKLVAEEPVEDLLGLRKLVAIELDAHVRDEALLKGMSEQITGINYTSVHQLLTDRIMDMATVYSGVSVATQTILDFLRAMELEVGRIAMDLLENANPSSKFVISLRSEAFSVALLEELRGHLEQGSMATLSAGHGDRRLERMHEIINFDKKRRHVSDYAKAGVENVAALDMRMGNHHLLSAALPYAVGKYSLHDEVDPYVTSYEEVSARAMQASAQLLALRPRYARALSVAGQLRELVDAYGEVAQELDESRKRKRADECGSECKKIKID